MESNRAVLVGLQALAGGDGPGLLADADADWDSSCWSGEEEEGCEEEEELAGRCSDPAWEDIGTGLASDALCDWDS